MEVVICEYKMGVVLLEWCFIKKITLEVFEFGGVLCLVFS